MDLPPAGGEDNYFWRRVDKAICICGHPRLTHKYDPNDYDRHDCLTCMCPKFDAGNEMGERPTYAQRLPSNPILRYREV